MDIVLYTDFGSADIYLGQVKSVLHRIAPRAGVIDLANDLPPFNVRAAAHLLDRSSFKRRASLTLHDKYLG
ncbi:MAG: hypothetical protein A2W81_00180 [Betaproteobacteria bacterium RIFCSPLOWO2_12_61_14]|nr:MAG: hypothetical protein A2W81_00180 [Betaproteobacteria bacterium RIFCSPLOWO2_12_61_14]